MAHFFRAPDRRQRFLLPLDMMEWLPEDDIVHLMVDAVGLMDLSKFEATCKVGGAGRPPFAPAMLLTVLIHAYSHGVRSSRVIERLCRRDAGYRFIVGDEVPDHTAIARFRQRHVGEMKGVFLQVLDLCREAGLIRLGLVALDGTEVTANAGLDANRTASTIGEQVSRMLAEAEATDAQEDRQFGADAGGPVMPKCLGRHARPPGAAEGVPGEAESPRRCRGRATAGARAGGRPGARCSRVYARDPAPLRRHLVTTHIISGMPTAPATWAGRPAAGPGPGRSDAGKDARRRPCPCRRVLVRRTGRQVHGPRATKRGRALYRQRGAAIEPVFGQMKDRQGADRFSMRGLERCRGEWQLDAAVHNLRKLHRDSVRRAENTGNSETTVRNPA